MLDYWKIWIKDKRSIDAVLNNKSIKKDLTINEDGNIIGIAGEYQNWKIRTLSPFLLQITGSIHKYWNNGTNETDFSFSNAIDAIKNFCNHFTLNPSLLFIKNLEFGLNLQLEINASEVLDQIICFNTLQPIRPYENKPDCYFMEFEQCDYYLKVYDKGKQYAKQLPGTPNTLRVEVKGMNSRFFKCADIKTVNDLMDKEKLQVLGLKFAKIVKGIVFDDDTIIKKELSLKERKIYRELSNPRNWKRQRGKINSSFRYKANQFKKIVENNGSRKINNAIETAINDKLRTLFSNSNLLNLLPNTYTLKYDKKRCCVSCGNDISGQHKNSLFCSAKSVGERAAKKCRNSNSNARNNLSRKIKKIESKGVLFPIAPYIVIPKKTA